jgi:hypothetical protein
MPSQPDASAPAAMRSTTAGWVSPVVNSSTAIGRQDLREEVTVASPEPKGLALCRLVASPIGSAPSGDGCAPRMS